MDLNKEGLKRILSPKSKPVRSFRGVINNIQQPGHVSNSRSNIKVFVRVRPLCEGEQTQNNRNTLKVIDDKMLIFDPKEETKEEVFFFNRVKQKTCDNAKKSNKAIKFFFEKIFSGEANNAEVYEGTTDGIITNLLEGYNCSVFAYGATGAGKTHTMLGNKNNPGITILTMTDLFRQIEELKATKEIDVGVTYLEVYNENVYNLIHPSGPMDLMSNANGGVLLQGLQMQKIVSADQLFQLLQQGNLNRAQHPTAANAESSRSHAVVQVYVKIQTKASGEVKTAKLSMIDLAGPERGSAGAHKEGSNINKSLLALGKCINNLADGLCHIPYRDSKLTRLLEDSLGGNCHTVMIANVSPSKFAYDHTYNTLKYAKDIKTQFIPTLVEATNQDLNVMYVVEPKEQELVSITNPPTINVAPKKSRAIASVKIPSRSTTSGIFKFSSGNKENLGSRPVNIQDGENKDQQPQVRQENLRL